MKKILRILLHLSLLSLTAVACGYIIFQFSMYYAWKKLPDLDAIKNYQPDVPLRIYSADNHLIAEFGEQKRNIITFDQTPDLLIKAILAAEDASFFEHGGVDYQGIARSLVNNFQGNSQQGGSTITMQVARNFFLSSVKTYDRKFYEIALSYKIEEVLDKKAILELYVNHIFLGHRSYGFASAAKTYFSKSLNELSLAEIAILAALPKAPSETNPITNPYKTKDRQEYVLRRMLELNFISRSEFDQAMAEPIAVNRTYDPEHLNIRSEYVAELARQFTENIFGEDAHALGLNVYTSIISSNQTAAYLAVRKGILSYERRYGYRGPEGFIELPSGIENNRVEFQNILKGVLSEEKHLDSAGVLTAVVLEASPKSVTVARSPDEIITITSGEALRHAARGLQSSAPKSLKIVRGSIIRIVAYKDTYEIFQKPEVQSALVALDPQTGFINALVGGFDFKYGNYNRATQTERQPGSGFKPFIYAAGLSKGISASTMVSDGPFILSAAETGSKPWQPKNADGKFGPPMTVRQGLFRSRNMVTIRILDYITPQFAQQYIANFGFNPNKHPAFLTMGLGAGNASPLQMANAYAVFANGGYRVDPILITKITDRKGNVLFEAIPRTIGDPKNEAIDPRIAFVIDSMLKDVVRKGTARGALALKRNDLAGKTGTTNKAVDTWFNGYNTRQVASVWMGYDKPKPLGNREFGSSSALPIWVDYMQVALKDVPESNLKRPEGIVVNNGEFYLKEFTADKSLGNLGHDPLKDLIEGFAPSEDSIPGVDDANTYFAPATEPINTVPVAPQQQEEGVFVLPQ